MACQGCSNQQCNCFTENGSSTVTVGNGSNYAPFTFRPNYIPFPRPFGHVYGRNDQALDGAPYSLFVPPPDIDGGGNMVGPTVQNLIAPADGLYLCGITVPFDSTNTDNLNDNFSLRRNGVQVSTATYANSSTGGAFVVFLSATTLLDLNAGDSLDLFVERVAGVGSITVEYFTVLFSWVSHPHLWAIWMGGGI